DHVAGGQVLEQELLGDVGDAHLFGTLAFLLIGRHQPALDLPADAAQGRRSEDAFGRAAGTKVNVDTGFFRVGRPDDAGDVAVRDELHGGADATDAGDNLSVS